ncbi:MAG: hypothetical protein HUJ77_03690 [Clostridium sp.]|uniref:hypothetical protein n=1 Tax=Clostridium sp. TaxID=1506 RepID=UPI0025BB729F|nr:hypothetical protein [Clostridium sp.]MCF0147480.1 hypothetical protein [Clostridium sp.]
MSYPVNFKITDKSSEYYKKVNYDLLYNQYNKFINSLSKNNIQLYFIDINKNATNQVFTQNIGFVVDDILGTNYVYLGNRKLLSSNESVGKMLQENGYEVQLVDYSEIMKNQVCKRFILI